MKTTLLLFSLSFSLISAAQIADNKSIMNDTVYFACDKNPEYRDGVNGLMKFIADSLIYPENSLVQGVQGKVVVRLIIEKDGIVEEAEVLAAPDLQLAQEAVRVLSLTSGKWTAGEMEGKKVRSYFTMPVVFKIKEEPVYTELKSDDPVSCLEKKAEYTGGANEFLNLVASNLGDPVTDAKIVRVVAGEGKVKNAKKNHRGSNNLKEIQTLEIEMTNTDYTTKRGIISKSINIIDVSRRSGPFPAIIYGNSDEKVEGNTLVRFVIEKDGMVSNVKIVETKCEKTHNNPDYLKLVQSLEKEIIRMIYLSAGQWIPAEMNCEKVRIYVTIPVNWKYITRSRMV
jgi:protein TonB